MSCMLAVSGRSSPRKSPLFEPGRKRSLASRRIRGHPAVRRRVLALVMCREPQAELAPSTARSAGISVLSIPPHRGVTRRVSLS